MLKQNTESSYTYNLYADRIKNLVKSQEKLWELYDTDSNLENKRKILEDLVNLQPVIVDWYNASKKITELDANTGVYK